MAVLPKTRWVLHAWLHLKSLAEALPTSRRLSNPSVSGIGISQSQRRIPPERRATVCVVFQRSGYIANGRLCERRPFCFLSARAGVSCVKPAGQKGDGRALDLRWQRRRSFLSPSSNQFSRPCPPMSWAEEVARRRRVAMEGEKVVYSRSQLLLAATKPLEDAFEMFMPESKRFMSSDTELWNFLCSLKNDFSPVILCSKDVYGYSSCRSVVPDPSQLARGRARGKRGGAASSKPRKPPVKKKRRRGPWFTPRKRRRGKPAGLQESGTSPSQEETWRAGDFPSIRVHDVSTEAAVAAARARAQSILRVNLQPVVRLEQHRVLSAS